MIDNEYSAFWVLDSLPAGWRWTNFKGKFQYSMYEDGFPLGYKQAGDYYIFNHHNIIIQVNKDHDDQKNEIWYVVGFLVEPLSLSKKNDCNTNEFNQIFFSDKKYADQKFDGKTSEVIFYKQDESVLAPQPLNKTVKFSYSVIFEDSNTTWSTRWEHYFYMSTSHREVHWLGLVNSFAMVLLLTGMVGAILKRVIHRDISHYNDTVEYEDETGWKQVRSDVFRSPVYGSMFSIIIGSGVQFISMISLTLFFTALGFLSPAHRGGLLTTILVLFVFMGIFAGYTSARLFKMFGGVPWKRNALGTAMIFPGTCFCMFFFINFFLITEESSGAVSFSLLLQLVLMWFGISVPLVFLGAFIGFSKPPIMNPVRVSKIPKPIQMIPGLSKIKLVGLLAGCLPFGGMFIELSYVMNCLWNANYLYYLFGFLFLCFIVLIITSAEVSILLCYILLCREDYRWWWMSFGVSGSSGLYLFGYAVIYWALHLGFTRVSSFVLYFGYMALGSMFYALITGTIGFIASFIFIRSIFSLIKID
jgi:transmembrane 9 superfamily protein 2/4